MRSLEEGLDRLFKNFYHLWKPLEELRSSPSPEALLGEWREASRPSQEWRNAHFYGQAVEVLSVSLGLPRGETEALVWRHIAEDR